MSLKYYESFQGASTRKDKGLVREGPLDLELFLCFCFDYLWYNCGLHGLLVWGCESRLFTEMMLLDWTADCMQVSDENTKKGLQG